MTHALIFRDCDGIPGRVDTIRGAFSGEVYHVAPHHLGIPGAVPVEIPDAWLPWGAEWRGVSRARKEWFAADALGLAAVRQLEIDADFIWFVESDICGPVEKWRELFTATDGIEVDGIFAKLMPRAHPFAVFMDHWKLPTSGGATHAHLMTLYRLSRRAIGWALDAAEGLSEVYAEVKTASMIVRHGGTVADLREFVEYSAPRAFTGHPENQLFHAGVLNHPVKFDIGKKAGC
jgi:hypothetical protein